MAVTLSTDLIIPEVFADLVAAEYPNKIVMAPLAVVDNTLVGQPGNTITRPQWSRLNPASDIAETDVIVPQKLTQTSDQVTIKEAAMGFEVSDTARLVGLGDPLSQGREQITDGIAYKIDTDLYTTAAATAAGMTVTNPEGTFGVAAIAAAFAKFPENTDPSRMFAGLVVSNEDYYDLLTSDLLLTRDKAGNDATLFSGSVGRFMGVPVIVSNRASAGALLVRRNSLVLAYKARPVVETDRDILARTTVVTASVHYGTFLSRQGGIVKITTTRV